MTRIIALVFIALLPAHAAATALSAERQKGFDAALADVVSHNRAALAHLREDDTRLALIEIALMQETFGLFSERYGKDRPAFHVANPDYTTTLVDVPVRIVTAHMMINFGRVPIAYNSLVATCRALMALRRTEPDQVAEACGDPVELPRRAE